ncbi:hypothetical protein [uncultured Roseobacter sp.]|uniref:hypothetical protein n=1 Tax=uncultured Roseobacter sp. TaxID=114847 RepID=UPI00260FB215|nr:hypothetical protein [uncultured Roseobacter sp.]
MTASQESEPDPSETPGAAQPRQTLRDRIKSTMRSPPPREDERAKEAMRRLEEATLKTAQEAAERRQERTDEKVRFERRLADELGLEKAFDLASNEDLVQEDMRLILNQTVVHRGGPWNGQREIRQAEVSRFRQAFQNSAPPGWFPHEPKSTGRDLKTFDFGIDRVITLVLLVILLALFSVFATYFF